MQRNITSAQTKSICILFDLINIYVYYALVTPQEFKRWLTKQGCTFASGKGGHLKVFRGALMSVLPMHGKGHELGNGLIRRIKQDLGLL